MIVPKNPGGGTDTSIRGLLEYMSQNNDALKFNVTNNSDGGGITGMVQTANAKNDGYTLGAVTVELDMFPFQGKTDLTYKSFDSIAMPIAAPAALIVQGDAPYNTVDEFVKYCQEHPSSVQVQSGILRPIFLKKNTTVKWYMCHIRAEQQILQPQSLESI